MTSHRFLGSSLAAVAVLLAPIGALADSTVNQAFQVARGAVAPALQTHVVSVYGTGTPEAIQKWYIIFYDAAVASHGRAVLVENNQVVKTYPAMGGAVYRSDLAFDPSRLSNEGPALSAAQGYAAKHDLNYDTVHALLKQTGTDRPFRWRIELLNAGRSKGYVFVNALDSSVAAYAPASSSGSTTSHHHGSVESDADDFGGDVKHTFLGIGGDLQEFFTGERTVDRDTGGDKDDDDDDDK